jgi:membrane protein required for colicin V production
MAAFTALDIIVLLLVGGAGVLGFLRGFTTEVLSLMAWIAAVFAVKLFHGMATELLTPIVGTASGAMVLAFALVFGIVFFAGRLTARAIGRRTRQSALGAFDRVLGVGFGALKGLVMASVLFLGVSLVFDTLYGGRSQRPEWMAKSYTYPLLDATSRALVDIVQQRQASGGGTSAS